MKKVLRIVSLLLVVVIMLSMTACNNGGGGKSGDGSRVVMSYGDFSLTEKDYMYIVSLFKSQMIEEYSLYLSQYGMSYSESDLLEMQLTEDMTMADYISDISVEFAQQMLIYEQLCADSGLSITSQTDLDAIAADISDMEFAYGGKDLFEIELARLGITRSAVERFIRANYMYNLVFEYRYGENGVAKVSSESVYQKFTEDYLRYEGALFAYKDYDSNKAYTFEYTDDEIAAFFDENYVKVRHILYMTVDKSGNKLSDEKIAEKKSKAEVTLNAVQSGEKTMDDLKSETEDSGYEYIFTHGKMVEAFEKAAFEMEVGEYRLVETEYGYHVIEKLAKTDEDLNGVKGEDGKTKGGMKDEVYSSMCEDKIRDDALLFYADIQNGTVTEFPEKIDGKDYYVYLEPGLIDKNNTTYYATFIEMLDKIEVGSVGEKNFADDATYIIKRLDITKDHITADIYSSIEEDLAFESIADYIQSFYDKVEINQELLDNFDVTTIPLLDSNLYNFG